MKGLGRNRVEKSPLNTNLVCLFMDLLFELTKELMKELGNYNKDKDNM